MFESPLEFMIKFHFVCLAAQDEYVRTDLLLGQRETRKNKEGKNTSTHPNISLCSPETYVIRIMLSDSLSHTQECKEAGGQETTRL